jgi:fatty-acyl-CoA synthase
MYPFSEAADMQLPVRWSRSLQVARSALRVLKSTGLDTTMSPRMMSTLVQVARDLRRGMRGGMALIHMHALSDPLRPALVSGSVRLNYGELQARVYQLTHGLRALGIGPGERIAAFLHNGHEYVELSAALQIVGGQSVQIGYRLKAQEVAYILENSGARALLFHDDLAPVVVEALALVKGGNLAPLAKERCIAVGHVPGFRSYEALLDGGDPRAPAQVPGGGYGGVMVYTSGTTGHAKGASRDFKRMGLGPVLDFMSRFPIHRDERHLVVCPLYHSLGQALASMVQFVGGCNVIMRHFDAAEALRAIEHERITSMAVVPTMLTRLVAVPPAELRGHDTSSLRWIMSGAAPLPTELARQVEDAFGPILYNFYGATETGIVTIALPGEHTARPGTIGRIIATNDIRLYDGEGRQVPDGQIGELYVRNPMLMDGYYGNDKATQEATRDGYISVGDLGWRDHDGYYYLADRKTDMVISGGVNIYPWEIEQRLHEHPAVQEAAVVGVPDKDWGESLAAFVVLRPGQTATSEELGNWVRQTLADFKKPRTVLFVESLPRTQTGKVLKRELKQRLATHQASA